MKKFRVQLFPKENKIPRNNSSENSIDNYIPTILLIIGILALVVGYKMKLTTGYIVGLICICMRYFLIKGRLSDAGKKPNKPQLRKGSRLDLRI